MNFEQFISLSEEAKIVFLDKARKAYYDGEEIISDDIYELFVDQLDDPQGYRDNIGSEVDGSRKRKLPVIMSSINKVKTIEDLQDWAKNKKFPLDTEVIVMPKFDGVPLLVNLQTLEAYTRGDGKEGQLSTEHFAAIPTKIKKQKEVEYINGEVMMSKAVFNSKYASTYKNSRNLIAGLLNSKEVSDILKDCVYIAYNSRVENETALTKEKIIDRLNYKVNNSYRCGFITTRLCDLTTEFLQKLKNEWEKDFILDGIVIEVNVLGLQEKLGREPSGKAVYNKAWKGFAAEHASTTILDIVNQVSKLGELRPVGCVKPVELDGVTVSRVSLKNWKNIANLGCGIGSVIDLERSGGVIPELKKVLTAQPVKLPTNCPSCNSKTVWDENHVHLLCSNESCETRQLHKTISFFEILEIDNVGEGIVEQLYNSGYKTVEAICKLTINDLKRLEGFGDRKAEIVYNNIHNKLKSVSLEKLQHASGFFKGLGSKKLALFSPFINEINAGNVEKVRNDLLTVEGLSDKSIQSFIAGNSKFLPWAEKLPITIIEKKETIKTGNKCEKMVAVFTGFRDKAAEQFIEENGGTIGSGVSKNTTHLIMKEKGSGSSKEKKALSLGITIWDKTDLEQFLGN